MVVVALIIMTEVAAAALAVGATVMERGEISDRR